MNTIEIEKRYNVLAEDNCCLSCGGAVNRSNPRTGETCVDLGCGRGNDVMKMASRVGNTGFVYGIDISDGMLGKAQKTAEKLGVGNVKFIRSNLESLPLEDNSVDLLISNCTINHISDKKAVWKEIYRILKTGGRFVVSDIYSDKEVPEEYRNNPVAVSECWAGSVTKEEYLRTLVNAGFKSIDLLEESNPYPKGKITVSSFTIAGFKSNSCCCC
ncbi:MAG: methyltransferase domain-containing protein [Bacteroidales bacterium]|nr:methyltransferase domain-containing protein [Bacteroidales bacterium]